MSEPIVIDGWTLVDDSNPASVPQEMGYFLVAQRTPSSWGPGYDVTESFFHPNWKHLTSTKLKIAPSRKIYGKYSRCFESAWMGYKVHWWMPKPKPPELPEAT